MITVYVTTPGAKIFKDGGTLKVIKDGAVYHTIFPYRTEQVVIFGGVEISWHAMNTLLKHKITTVFLSKNGHFNGKLVPPVDSAIHLRRLQYEMLSDSEKCLSFCKAVARGKMKNQLVMLGRIARFQNRDIKQQTEQLKDLISKVDGAVSAASLRGYEGSASKIYFSVFNLGFTKSQGFKKRVRRPPTDPVNAVLSLIYTVLGSRVEGAVEREGLDPYAGIFHSIGRGTRSLPLDLIEEFRTIIADTLTFSLFNLGIVGKDDFRKIEPQDEEAIEIAQPDAPDILKDKMSVFSELAPVEEISTLEEPVSSSLEDDGHEEAKPPKTAVYLNPSALKKVIAQFERKLETEFTHPLLEEKMTYRDSITVQVRQFVSFLRNETPDYIPLVMR
ncbi:MAG TPA: CRISPR-associated endonuclease Cas1 [Desulfomonilia bacterium]